MVAPPSEVTFPPLVTLLEVTPVTAEVVRVGTTINTNVAVQVLLASIKTETEEFVPLQSPLQPVKIEPALAEAVAVAVCPELYVPAPVTVPEPVPALLMVRV